MGVGWGGVPNISSIVQWMMRFFTSSFQKEVDVLTVTLSNFSNLSMCLTLGDSSGLG